MRTRVLTLTLTLVAAVMTGVPLAPAALAATPFHDGDPATTERLAQLDPTRAAVDVSRARFADHDGAGRHAAFAVLSRDDVFADSLAASALTSEAPLLFTRTASLTAETLAELQRVLPPSGRVYLLGGPAAISNDVADELRDRGFDVRRLAGQTRVETAMAVADLVRALYGDGPVLIARAWGLAPGHSAGWADSVSGGGDAADRRIPVLVTRTDTLDAGVAAWLDRDGPSEIILLGGTAALSDGVAAALPGSRRVWGQDRTGTAAAIAAELWGVAPSGTRSYILTNVDGSNGWAFGATAAGLAADGDVPILLVRHFVSSELRRAVAACGTPEVDLLVVGDGTVVNGSVREEVDALDGLGCGPDRTIVNRSPRLATFDGCPDLLAHVRELAGERVGPYGFDGYGPVAVDVMPIEGDARFDQPTGAPAAEAGDAAAPTSGDVIGTNVQEVGVDEPDLVKTDGSVAAVAAGTAVHLVDLTGAAPRVASTLEAGWGSELLLRGDRLLVLSTAYRGPQPVPLGRPALVEPGDPYGVTATTLRLYDIANPDAPTLLETVELDGQYRSARLIGDTARVVVQTGPHDLVFGYPQDSSREALIASAEHNRAVIDAAPIESWVPGYVVIAPDGARTDEATIPCGDIGRPPRFGGLGMIGVFTLDLSAGVTPTSSAGVLGSGEFVYASPDQLVVATSRWGAWEPWLVQGDVTTELHAFDISAPTSTTYLASGRVAGYLYSQFALSERGGLLRVASTSEAFWSADVERPQSESRVTVLERRGGEYVPIGLVDGLGKGERIHSVRFFDDFAAVVTFRQVDPLYLIDLATPTAPRVTGELKVTGFSSYLHLARDGLLLGVGQEATDEGVVIGPQVSTFDISDRTDPRQVGRVVFRPGWSEVQSDHRAFQYVPSLGRALVPLYEYESPQFTGAVAVDVSAGGSVAEAGRLTQPSSGSGSTTVGPQIRRTFVVGDTLYTVSDQGLGAHDLDTLARTSHLTFPTG